MNELQRHAYLDAMGIDSYYPKLLLPGAKAPELCEMGVALASPVIEVVTAENSERVADQTSSVGVSVLPGRSKSSEVLHALFDDSPSPKSHREMQSASRDVSQEIERVVQNTTQAFDHTIEIASQNTSLNVTESAVIADSTSAIPQFSLTIIRGANILIIDEGLNSTVNSLEYLQLVTNILFAVGAKVQQLTLDSFNWPMVRNKQIDQSETAAKQTLEAFLRKQVSHLSLSYIVVLGETAKTYLGEQASANGKFITHEELSVELICTHSALQMMSEPSVKKSAWSDLQPLFRVLKKN
jgi:hypothetical protein